ncbi:hypothetical protein KUTeg_008247 [Tegillarca granosa]|uniref:Chitin-binding type-2 domain-containing protein n=1 Tax=Tegillarca granosa TaxID=220873 RepID=A0ABQ9F8M5_TEGGR|nr:hypothetical protein KUTeg_008247 [Tegillarca granosa]
MQHFSQTMVTFDVYHFRFLLSISIMQGLSAFPVGDNTLPVDFPHASKLKGLLSDMCFGSQKRIVPHPEDCALYYNCSSIYRVIPLYMEQNLHECPYPKLFSTETNQCEMFHRVECGKRKEPKWECQYRKHWCRDDECLTPCASKYPSCIGKSDGLNPFRDGQSMLPYYLECEDERVVKIKICPRVPILTRFSPLTKRCEALYRIPIEYSKINTICKMKGDGYHADTFGRCKNYFRCTNGSFESFETCLGTQLFDQKRRVCAKPETICGRCGTTGAKCKNVQNTNQTKNESQDERSSMTESSTPFSKVKHTTGSTLAALLSSHVTTDLETSTTPEINNDENGRSITTETYYTYVTGAIEHVESLPTTQSNDPDFTKTAKLTTQSSVAEFNETTEQTQSSTAESTEHKHSSTTESTDHKQSSTAETTKQTKSSSTETTEHTHSSTTETTEQKQSSTAETTERTQSTATETTEHT